LPSDSGSESSGATVAASTCPPAFRRLLPLVSLALLVFLPLLLSLFACAPSSPVDLTVAHDAEPQTLDPALMTGLAEGRIATALFEGLTRLDPKTLEILPAMAVSWVVSPDGLHWVFRLRPGVTWSDGQPLTSEDFRWSWLRLLAPDSSAAYGNLLFDVKGARAYKERKGTAQEVGLHAPSPDLLHVHLERPVPYFGALAAFFTLLPVPRQAVEEHGDRWTRPGNIVSNGPYLLEHWSFYRELVLHRNPNYWDVDRVAVERIRLLPVVDPNTQFNLYETGGVDLLFSVPSPILDHLTHRLDYVTGSRLATAFLRLNVTRPPFDDLRVRQAFALAIDKEIITGKIMRGGEVPTNSLVPRGLPGYQPAPGLTGNVDRARELLAQAGYPGGRGFPPVALLYRDNPDQAALATVLQRRYQEILGVDVRLNSREWKVYISSMKRLDYDFVFGAWYGDYPDPATFLDCFRSGSGNNRTGWESDHYDELLDEAATPQPGETPSQHAERRLQLFSRAEEYLLTEGTPIIPLYHPTTRFMVAPRVKGFTPNLLGLVQFSTLRVRARTTSEDGE